MSGLTSQTYELTFTRAFRWHTHRRKCCRSLRDIGNNHLEGFAWTVGHGGNFMTVATTEEQAIYAAVRGSRTTRTK